MIRIERSDAIMAAAQLDQAIHNHREWFEAVTRALVCRIPPNPSDVAPDAHCQCRLGRWYYGAIPDALRRDPGFIALGAAHRTMHQEATRLLNSAAINNPIAPQDYDELARTLEQVRTQLCALKRELADAAQRLDPLTGAYCAAGMLTEMRRQHDLVRRRVQDCYVAVLNVDYFKDINDAYGHPSGDRVLVETARYLNAHLQPHDILFRYGSVGFLICMQGKGVAETQAAVERVREGLAKTFINFDGTARLSLSASFGMAALEPEVSVEAVIARADRAMALARASGRNKVRVWNLAMDGDG